MVPPFPANPSPSTPPSEPESTLILLDRVKAGDDAALETLLRRYRPRLRRWAQGRLPPAARGGLDTEDVIQDALVSALRQLDRFDPRWRGALHAYLRRAVLNRVRDAWRQAKVRREQAGTVGDPTDPSPSPLEEVIGAEALQHYERALAQLSETDRELIVGRVEMGCSYAELAELLGKSTSDAARVATRRALIRLAKQMDGVDEEEDDDH